jgi:site-specific DNA-methyltransferase (adenine-specific)
MSNFISGKAPHDNWATPDDVYQNLNQEFDFDYDPCPLNPKPLIDGLVVPWGNRVFVNPPYSNPRPWIEKAIEESKNGKIVVMLLRGDTSTAWFHDLVWGKAEVRFIRGRLRFNNKAPAPFPSIVAIYRPDIVQAQEGQVK